MKTMLTTTAALFIAATVYNAQVESSAGGSFFLTSNFSDAAAVLKSGAARANVQPQK